MKNKIEPNQCETKSIKLNVNSFQKKTNMSRGNRIESIRQTNNKHDAQS